MCSESRIAGKATFTTVASSMIMNSPDETAASVHHLLFSGVTSRPLSRSPVIGKACRKRLIVSVPGKTRRRCFLRPARARCGRVRGQHLACSRPGEHVSGAVPHCRRHEQRAAAWPSERARGAPAVKLDRLQHLAAFANAYAPLVRHVAVPDGVLGVEANTVGHAVTKLGPHAPV